MHGQNFHVRTVRVFKEADTVCIVCICGSDRTCGKYSCAVLSEVHLPKPGRLKITAMSTSRALLFLMFCVPLFHFHPYAFSCILMYSNKAGVVT